MKHRRKRSQKPCDAFFASHGCGKRKDHPDDVHECDCGMRWARGEGFGEDK